MRAKEGKGLHVAIIMDGNGRWATRRGLPRVAGHRAGVATVRRIVECALESKIDCLTLYAFSSDNWRRPTAEVQGIFWLLPAFLRLERERLRERGVRLQVIGRRDRLTKPVLQEICKAERITSAGTHLYLRVAVDYSSRYAIARGAVDAAGYLEGPSLAPDSLEPVLARVMAGENGDVDLLIRTGGEKRLSDFLLWELAYAELFFTDRMWPEFDETTFSLALQEFRGRERRFGAVPTPVYQAAPAPGGVQLAVRVAQLEILLNSTDGMQ
jgi:undecaprenyl diphosphate synthase